MMDTNKDETPFAFELVDPGSRLTLLYDQGDKFIRESKFTNPTAEDLTAKAQLSKDLIQELEKDYKIQTPGMEFVIGESTSHRRNAGYSTKSIYIVANKVDGKNFDEVEFNDSELDEVRDKLDQLVAGLARYDEDNFRKNKVAMGDIEYLKNYMYGAIKEGQEKKFYLVDVEPELVRKKPPSFIVQNIVAIAEDIKSAEMKLNGRKLSQARLQLDSLLNSIPESYKGHTWVQRMKERVEKGELGLRDILEEYWG